MKENPSPPNFVEGFKNYVAGFVQIFYAIVNIANLIRTSTPLSDKHGKHDITLRPDTFAKKHIKPKS